MDSDTPERFDAAAIGRLRRFGGDALLFEMIDLLTVSGPARLAVVREAIAGGDAATARAALHSLKSSTGQLGALALQALCERAEQIAAASDVAGVAALLPALDAESNAMVARLAAIRQGDA